ncbi:hypothetical protein G9A89_016758 [Geosiphon pyriformis]|nr:hypothetical protein G9A89_016758 [Geosiphon pyriformis]
MENNLTNSPEILPPMNVLSSIPVEIPLRAHNELPAQVLNEQSPANLSSSPHSITPPSPSSKSTSPEIILPKREFNVESKNRDSSFYQQLFINVDQPVGSMSISPSSRDVVLAARKGLFIIDLENPYNPPRVLNHLTKWEVADVQWNPHQARDTWVASTSNQKALIWNLDYSSSGAVKIILHSHTRAISDINWHPFNPDELATCSVDTFVHLWDLRIEKKPVMSFCAWTAGATQVKFNKKNQYILASSHDTDVKIWDTRRGSRPVTNIKAHTTKIYGIDWSRKNETDIITCSLDKRVKVWNTNQPEICQRVIETNSPVWRARHTPVGLGILTMPQRSENTLYLWNRENPEKPVYAFRGHTDVVKEFVWRVKGGGDPDVDDREFQLITWSKDQTLRLWPITDDQLKSIGHIRGRARSPLIRKSRIDSSFTFRDPPKTDAHSTSPTLAPSTAVSTLRVIAGNRIATMSQMRPSGASGGGVTSITSYMNSSAGVYPRQRSISPILWMQGVKLVKPSGDIRADEETPQGLAQEISSVVNKYQNEVKFEKINVTNRSCTISLHTHGPWSDSGVALLRINISFPSQYPDKTIPIFDIQKTGMISIMNRAHTLQILNGIALQHVSQKRPCLEACIRHLLGKHSPEDMYDRYGRDDSDEETLMNSSRRTSYDKSYIYFLGDKDDHNVLFPILCGARFSGNGQLVCFFSSLRTPDTTVPTTPAKANTTTTLRVMPTYTYTHPRSYESLEQYRAISRLPRQIPRYSGDENSLSDGQDDEDDVITPLLYFRPKGGSRETSSDPSNLFQPIKLDRTGIIVYIHDLSEWMPVSQKLALEYTLYGDDPVEICKYNAKVAAKHKRPDLEEVWLLASFILAENVPLERRKDISVIRDNRGSYTENLSLVMTNQAKYLKKRRDSGTGFDPFFEDFSSHCLFSKVQWGSHPWGVRLIRELFQHFAAIGDVQTLAILSCVLQEPFPPDPKLVWLTDYNAIVTPESLSGATTCATDYFNYYMRHPEKRSQSQNFLPQMTTQFVGTFADSFNSSKESWGTYQYQTSEASGNAGNSPTPPTPNYWREETFTGTGSTMVLMTGHSTHNHYNHHHHHHHHHHRRSTVGTANRDPICLPSSSSSNTSSPRTPKRSSPATGGGPISNRLEQLGWVEIDKKKPAEVDIVMMNCNEFDDERRPLHVPLLDPGRESSAIYDQYRLAYAELLYHWGLMEARAELLKFMCFVKSDNIRGTSDHCQTLEIFIHCHGCGAELKPDIKCGNCQRKMPGIKCSICHRIVKGLMNFCVVCSHGGHTDHLREWFAAGNNQCPSGCGCLCVLEEGGFGVDDGNG